MKTLLVEDDYGARELLKRLLQNRHCEVTACADAESAWTAFQAAPYDLAVLDWVLPGMDGLELCQKMRQLPHGERCVILVITARDQPEDLQQVLNAGADDYLTKPVEIERLNIRLAIAERQFETIGKRKAAEEALRESVERFNLAAQGTNDGFWDGQMTDGHVLSPGNQFWCSPRFKALLGYADHELDNVLETWTSRLHPDDRDRVFQALLDHTERHLPYDVEYRLRTKSGEYRWFTARGQAIWDHRGRAVRMAGSIRDITERRKFDEALRESEARYRLIAEKVTDIIWTARLAPPDEQSDEKSTLSLPAVAQAAACWRFTYLSPAVERLLEYTPEEAVELTLNDMLTADSYQRVATALEEELTSDQLTPDPWRQRTLEVEHVTKSGQICWCEVTSVFMRDDEGRAIGVLGVTRNITERKRAENALRESEGKWRSLVENAPDLIFTLDCQARILFMNRTVSGFDLTSVLGTAAFDYVQPEWRPRLQESFERVFRTGERESLEVEGFGPNGSLAWYSSRVGPVKLEGEVVALMVIATDITPRKAAEEAIKKEQRLLKKLIEMHERERRLVAYEIHDGVVQHMTGSLMHLEAFAQARQANSQLAVAEYEQSLRLLRTAVGEARRLISGLRPPILDELGIVAAVEYLVNEARQGVQEVEFVHSTDFQRLAPPLESAIFRIVQEALTNVRRHSETSRARVQLLQKGDRLQVEVRDWGKGFNLDEIREESFGLQGVRERARLFDGHAVIDSSPGKGTRVTVDFALLDPK